jgi:uncharacterized repeat protein (TIGR01451 family)
MSRTKRCRYGGVLRSSLAAIVAAVLVASPLVIGSLAGAAPTVFGGFEVDGDLNPAGGGTDWQTAAPLATITDAVQGSGDSDFKGGSKEEQPDSWVYGTDNNPPNKNDLVRGYVSQSLVGSELYLFTSFRRTSANGDVHLDFEFNQDGTVVNAGGFTIPRRQAGDLLVTFDGNGASLEVRIWRWAGNEHSGTWDLLPSTAGTDWLAALNANTVTDPLDGGASSPAGTFGEAALNLTHLGIALSCPGFGSTWMKTRSSESISAELKDRTDPAPVDLTNCGRIVVHKADDHTPPHPLSGAVFGLYDNADASGPSAATCTSVADGTCTFDGVAPRTWWVKEISAPAGYAPSTQIAAATVGVRETVDVQPPFVDPRDTGSITVAKHAGGAIVSGVRFVILSGGAQAHRWPGGEPAECVTVAGSCTVSGLLLGTYSVHEDPSTVPSTQFAAADQTATIASDGETVALAFDNPLRPVGITVRKTVAEPRAHVGDVLHYTIDVHNPGDVALAVALDDSECAGMAGPAGDDGDAVLAPMGAETWTYACTHVVAPGDPDPYVNHVTVHGTDEFGRHVSATSQASSDILKPAVTIDKKVGGADHATSGQALLVHAGDDLDYTVVVRNTGDANLTITGLADTLHADLPASCDHGNGFVLEPGTEIHCAYTDAADGDAHNVASVTGTDALGGPKGTVHASDGTYVKVLDPRIGMVKNADPTLIHAADTVTYTYVVTNTGNTALQDVSVSDDKLGPVGDAASLAPGASRTFTKPAAIDADTTNIGTATAHDSLGKQVRATDSADVDVIRPSLRIDKSVDHGTVHAGEQVVYSYVVTNTGDVDLAPVSVSDDRLGAIGSLARLHPGQAATLHSGAVTISGDTTNVGTAIGTDPLGATVRHDDDATVRVIDPRITLRKSGPAQAHDGDTVTYTFVVTNTGDTALGAVTLTDPTLGVTLPVPALAPGDSATLHADHVVAAGVDPLINDARVCGTDQFARQVCGDDTHRVDPLHPAITLDKKVEGSDHTPVGEALVAHAGDVLHYTVAVRNTGDTPLRISGLTDSLHAELGTSCDHGNGFVLEPGAEIRCAYTDTADDDAHNVASVVGTDALGGPKGTVRASDETFVDVVTPAIAIAKTAAPATVHAGDVVTYTYTITNTGDTALNDVTVTDDKLGAVGGAGTLDPGETAVLTKAASITADTTNVATASGTDRLGKTVTASDDASVDVIHPAVKIVKTVDKDLVHAGEKVVYTYRVTNTGDVPLHNVSVTDDKLGAIGSAAVLGIGASTELVSEEISIEGQTTNVGTVTGIDPLGKTVSSSEDAKVDVIDPNITLAKSGIDVAHEGDTIVYSFDVTNTGATPLSAIVLTDPMLKLTLAVPPLLPGASAMPTGNFTIPAGSPDPLINNARVCGVDLLGESVCADDTHTVDIIKPAITVTKVADPTIVSPGDTVAFTYVVTNAGDTPLGDVTLDDDVLGGVGSIDSLQVGASRTFTKTEVVTPTTPATNVVTACGRDRLAKRVCAGAKATITQVLPLTVNLPQTGAQAARIAALGFFLIALGAQLAWARRASA